MPPRYVYWTILIDNRPTAFRAHKQEELLPTFQQLRRTNPDIVMKWFAHGRLWDSPEQAQWARDQKLKERREKRGPEWRPGGRHQDPRARNARQQKGPTSPKSQPPRSDRREATRQEPRSPSTRRPALHGRPMKPRPPNRPAGSRRNRR